MDALILVDIQRDFLPGGALAVPQGDAVIPIANQLQKDFSLIVATQDWHPPNHGSFAANHPGARVYSQILLGGLMQTLWPVHCVQNTPGAELAPGLNRERIVKIFRKGTDPLIDSYSGFFDNGHRRATGMGQWLQEQGVTEVYLSGLATDYCVKYTTLDGLALGFKMHIFEEGCRGINVHPGQVDEALQELRRAGAEVLRSC